MYTHMCIYIYIYIYIMEEIAGAGRQVGAEEQELRSRGRTAQEELRLAKAECAPC